MTYSAIPENVQRFIARHINSIEQLEVLLLLHAQPQRFWTAEEVANELRIDASSAKDRLQNLHQLNLLSPSSDSASSYQYAPSPHQVGQIIDELANVYAIRRVSVIQFIFSQPIDRIRVFADAFRLKKDD